MQDSLRMVLLQRTSNAEGCRSAPMQSILNALAVLECIWSSPGNQIRGHPASGRNKLGSAQTLEELADMFL